MEKVKKEEYAEISIEEETPTPTFEPLESAFGQRRFFEEEPEEPQEEILHERTNEVTTQPSAYLDYGISEEELNRVNDEVAAEEAPEEEIEPEIEEASLASELEEPEELESTVDEEDKLPLYKTMPAIFSSVYLEPRDGDVMEPVLAPVEVGIEEEPMIGEELEQESEEIEETPEFDPDLIEEEDIIQKPEVKIYPDIYEELQPHREAPGRTFDMSIPFDANRLAYTMPGKIIYSEPEDDPIQLDEEEERMEVVLTPEILKQRLAKLNKMAKAKADVPKPKQEDDVEEVTAELDHILKQMGLDNNAESSELENNEHQVLGR
jgi:hypothetical protein